MKKYRVAIEERLYREVEVEAENADEAYMQAKGMYDAGDVVLDAEDLMDVEIEVIE